MVDYQPQNENVDKTLLVCARLVKRIRESDQPESLIAALENFEDGQDS